ncbi:MAG: DUF2382 domain-containing protein [Polyangia bacterium]
MIETIGAGAQVIDTSGQRGVVESAPGVDGSSRVILLFDGGQRVRLPAEMITAQPDGTYRVPFSLAALQRDQPGGPSTGLAWVFPVMKEELAVERRTIDIARVRVTKSVREEQRIVDEPLWRDEVGVELVEVNRVVDGPVAVRQEGDTVIVPVLEEVLVVEKRLLLREELRLTRRRTEVRSPKSVTLRAEDVRVERIPINVVDPGVDPGAARAASDSGPGSGPEFGTTPEKVS